MTEYKRTSRTANKQEYWQRHIAGYKSSSLSQKQYCLRHGLPLSTFCYWRKKLETEEHKQPHFYPLTVRPLPSPDQDASASGSGLTLLLNRNRFRLEMAENFSSTCLKKLIATLEQL